MNKISYLPLIIIYMLLNGCNGQYKSEQNINKQATIAQFIQVNQTILDSTAQKFEKIIQLSEQENIKTLDFDQKLILDFPVCGGYSDTCRFQPENLCITLMKRTLKGEKNEFSGKNFTPYIIRYHLRIFEYLYDRMNQQLDSTAKFPYITRDLNQDLYNARMIWEAPWFLLLEVTEYELPESAYSTHGYIKGYWHFYDFKKADYLGSIPIESGISSDYTPPSTRDKQVEKTKTTQRYLPNGRTITDRQTVPQKPKQNISMTLTN